MFSCERRQEMDLELTLLSMCFRRLLTGPDGNQSWTQRCAGQVHMFCKEVEILCSVIHARLCQQPAPVRLPV